MKRINKVITTILAIALIMSYNITYASMADFTDGEADKVTKQKQEKWQKEQEEKINKSSNNYLQSLLVENYEITPKFDKQTINYEISKEVKEDYIEIKAETDDQKSSVSGVGKIMLNSGDNNLRIDVTAENGMVRTYFLKVKRRTNKNLKIKELKISSNDGKKIEIIPEFNEEIYEYNCTVESYIDDINIDVTSNTDDVLVEIIGNNNLKEGLNEVFINLSNNKNEKIVYKINVNKKQAVQLTEEKHKNFKIVLIISVLIIIIVIVLLKKEGEKKYG